MMQKKKCVSNRNVFGWFELKRIRGKRVLFRGIGWKDGKKEDGGRRDKDNWEEGTWGMKCFVEYGGSAEVGHGEDGSVSNMMISLNKTVRGICIDYYGAVESSLERQENGKENAKRETTLLRWKTDCARTIRF